MVCGAVAPTCFRLPEIEKQVNEDGHSGMTVTPGVWGESAEQAGVKPRLAICLVHAFFDVRLSQDGRVDAAG